MAARRITPERLRQILNYDPETGIFTWRQKPNRNKPIGALAGTRHRKGHWQITVDGGRYFAHCLAWLWVYGVWPENQIDHRNAIRADNRIGNLRQATQTQNNANRQLGKNACGYKGVSLHRQSGLFRARIKIHRREHCIGYYATAPEAHRAYVAAAQSIFGEFARSA